MSPALPPAARPLPAVLDIEASGFGRRSYPIEVGYIQADGTARCMLVRPEPDWVHWDETAAQVHGIERSVLLSHGRTPAEVAETLNRDLRGQTVYCDGWAHDYPWLAALFDAGERRMGFRLESITRLLNDAQLAALDAARRRAREQLGLTRHRASNDARTLQAALAQVMGQRATVRADR